MNADNYDMDKMRETWIKMGKALGIDLQPSNPNNMNRKNTSLDRLRDRYRRGCDLSIVGTIVCTLLFLFIPWINDNNRISLATTVAVLMSANSYMLYWLWRGIGKIDPIKMPIEQVSSLSRYYKKCHLLYSMIGFAVALLWVGYFAYVVTDSKYGSIDSIITGFIIGGIFGFYGLWKYMRDYRDLSE